MSRLRRLRSWWLSLYLPRRPASQTKRHRDLFSSQEDYYEWRERHRRAPLTPEEWDSATLYDLRLRLEGGTYRRDVSTLMKGLGTRTPATAITAECSSSSRPGAASADGRDLTLYRLPSSFTEPSSFGDVTAAPGGSGAPLDSAG